jgi:hypothetical protein
VTVLIYLDTSKQVGDPDHLKVFTNADAAEKWFEENDPEGVVFEYKVQPVSMNRPRLTIDMHRERGRPRCQR